VALNIIKQTNKQTTDVVPWLYKLINQIPGCDFEVQNEEEKIPQCWNESKSE
jgi:hypothetical protein